MTIVPISLGYCRTQNTVTYHHRLLFKCILHSRFSFVWAAAAPGIKALSSKPSWGGSMALCETHILPSVLNSEPLYFFSGRCWINIISHLPFTHHHGVWKGLGMEFLDVQGGMAHSQDWAVWCVCLWIGLRLQQGLSQCKCQASDCINSKDFKTVIWRLNIDKHLP